MAGKKDKNKGKSQGKAGGKKPKRLSRGDAELWKMMTKDVSRLPGRGYEAPEEEVPAETRSESVREKIDITPAKKSPKQQAIGRDVDGATARKFTRGKMEIEATIDLHGLGQAEAREALRRFITASHRQGRRCVLVITGKGLMGRPGVLKARVPEWLEEMGPVVLKTAPAQLKHGGQGAIYVLLRRHRL